MPPFALPIVTVDPRTADDRTMLAIGELNIRSQRLALPEEPVLSSAAQARIYRVVPESNQVCDWLIWNGETLAGLAFAVFSRANPADRTMFFNIIIDPAYRRQGLGRALLEKVYAYALENGRAFLHCNLIDREQAGNRFMERMGGKAGLVGKIHQLELGKLDRGLLSRWTEQAQHSAPVFEVGIWENCYPEEDLAGVAEMINEIRRSAPHGDLEMPPADMTPDEVREFPRLGEEMGVNQWTAYARERASGQIVGISSLDWHNEQPAILNQRGTVVLARCRNRGLGRWVKAAMLEKVLRDLPQARFVRTHNANSNAPMLKINTELGFKPFFEAINWQVSVEDVGKYLMK